MRSVYRFILTYFIDYHGSGLTAVFISILIISFTGCTEKFIPVTGEDKNLIVVEGLITDQPGKNIIKLSQSQPLGLKSVVDPLTGCQVSVSDDEGNVFLLNETDAGTYVTDPDFHGIIGRSYILHVKTDEVRHYESAPALLRPVPPIDSVYYERLTLAVASDGLPTKEGCSIYLNTHDPTNACKFYRWEFEETWQFEIPYYVANKICWSTSYSKNILVKNTTSLSDDRIERQPVNIVDNKSDRLAIKYSINVNQYSLSEDEYAYWEKLQQVVEDVGSLYDITPSSIASNIRCLEKPDENVLGYFSVSSVKSKRIFIKNQFRGLVDLYELCANSTVGYYDAIPGLGVNTWIIVDHFFPPPPYKILTFFRGCADCTVRGSTKKPDFWIDDN
jgi:hypothetical protein